MHAFSSFSTSGKFWLHQAHRIHVFRNRPWWWYKAANLAGERLPTNGIIAWPDEAIRILILLVFYSTMATVIPVHPDLWFEIKFKFACLLLSFRTRYMKSEVVFSTRAIMACSLMHSVSLKIFATYSIPFNSENFHKLSMRWLLVLLEFSCNCTSLLISMTRISIKLVLSWFRKSVQAPFRLLVSWLSVDVSHLVVFHLYLHS